VRIRKVKTASGSTAVQVVKYSNYKTSVLKHIGNAKTIPNISSLENLAQDWISQTSKQINMFPNNNEENNTLLNKYKYLGFEYRFAYEVINNVFSILGLDKLNYKNSRMFLDLSLLRVINPLSKRKSIKLLSSSFGINYNLSELYRSLPEFPKFKDLIENKLVAFAKNQLNFNFSFVLYDITTLYFETFTDDDFRKRGFSKDNKIGQPQILVGLIVSKDGFPLSFAVFEGSKFEGHTLIPTILDFKEKHKITTLTVVADAGMISKENITALKQNGLSYIVGARLGNNKPSTITQINQNLNFIDGATTRLKTNSGFLVCSFSSKRYSKDKHISYYLNNRLVEKTKLLLGIKGYHTDLTLPDKLIIERYSDLWNVEKAFRISKSDISIRPIYHFRKQAIMAHILICTTALAVLKFMEIKTGKSAKYVVDSLKSVTDGRMLNTVTNKEFRMRSQVTEDTKRLLNEMGITH